MSRHLAVECAECGHLHFTPHGYVLCPIAGCSCPYAAGEWPDGALDRLARLLEDPPPEMYEELVADLPEEPPK